MKPAWLKQIAFIGLGNMGPADGNESGESRGMYNIVPETGEAASKAGVKVPETRLKWLPGRR